jgi:hypothetical protein
MSKTPRRLRAENVSFAIGIDGRADHWVTVNLGYDPVTGALVEVAFCEGGKIGHGLHLLLNDLGIKLSRAIQRRSPDDGSSLPPAREAGR